MKPKILTVDDSKTIRLIVTKALKPFDVDVLEASNGVEGVAVAVPVVVADEGLADHDGIGGAVGGEFGEECFQFIMGFWKLAVGQAFFGAG